MRTLVKDAKEVSNLIEHVSAPTGEKGKNAIFGKALEHSLEFLKKRQTLTERIDLVEQKPKP